VPETYEPAADALDEDKVASALEGMRRAYLGAAEQLPTHADFIRRTCAAPFAAPRPPAPREPDLPTFSFESESPFAGFERSPV